MKVRIVYWGPAREWTGVADESLSLDDGAVLNDVLTRVFKNHPNLARGRDALRFAVNASFAKSSTPLADGDEIAVIPPVSGGSDADLVAIVHDSIDVESIREHVDGDFESGAVVTFEGVTRAETHPDHGPLVRLDYEAYEEMAVEQMRELVKQARERWSIGRLAVVHRAGAVDLGCPSVVISVACGHRGEAFDACRWLIDALKSDVPIWKKEVWSAGRTTWVDPTDTGAS